tara:strand:- start:4039 stop:4884 length:846 start_codon:yes stop_codon:yes gene_type:complete
MFKDVGISHIRNFINKNIQEDLNEEIDDLLNRYSINGVTRASTWINNNLCDINDPIVNINSVNLLEIIYKTHQEIIKISPDNYTLSSIRLMIERNNSHPITWHTDNKPGLIRAIIYLKGGENKNGNLDYIEGSHNFKHIKDLHKINPYELGLENKIITMDTQVGDLILFDINGFHKKNTTNKERRVIFMEFHDGKSSKKMGKVILDNSKFTNDIRKNLDFLFSNNDIDHKNFQDVVYSTHLPPNTPLRVFYYYFKSFCKLIEIKIKNKINIFAKRLKKNKE